MSKQRSDLGSEPQASFEIQVRDGGRLRWPIAQARVGLYDTRAFAVKGWTPNAAPLQWALSDHRGRARFDDVAPGSYQVVFMHEPSVSEPFTVGEDCAEPPCLEPFIDARLEDTQWISRDCKPIDCRSPQVGEHLQSKVSHDLKVRPKIVPPEGSTLMSRGDAFAEYSTPAKRPGRFEASYELHLAAIGTATGHSPAVITLTHEGHVDVVPAQPVSGQLGIALSRSETEPTEDLTLWVAIRNGTEALSFNQYLRFMDLMFGGHRNGQHKGLGKGGSGPGGPRFEEEQELFDRLKHRRFLPFNDSDSYRVLKAATEAFVMVNCGVLQVDEGRDKAFRPRHDNAYLGRRDLPGFDDLRGAFEGYLERPGGILPYLALVARKLPDIPIIEGSHDGANLAVGFVHAKLANPCLLELIWSYWHEEAMLVQTMNAVTRRFQNQRSPGTSDPLANLEVDPLRPLSNLLWGYTQDEQHRLTVNRRSAEYDHHYGLRLQGKAVRDFRAADSRSQFLEGFHHLLRLLTVFYKQDDDTTVKADAFPVLNALKENHLGISQGAHNQFGDLPSTARIEMLMQQWLLGRPEFREFLPSRIMVAYPEPWMDRVDAMKKLQGWTDTSVVHFRNLAIFGEQIMLSIRYGAWSEVYEPTQAFNWARFWRPQVQGYIHAYRAATGVDMSGENADPSADATLPSLLIQRRMAQQQRSA